MSVWKSLTRAPVHLTNSEHRRQFKQLSSLFVFLFLVMFLSFFLQFLSSPQLTVKKLSTFGIIVGLFFAYFMIRKGLFRISVLLICVLLSLPFFFVVWNDPKDIQHLFFIILGILLAGFFLPLKQVLLFTLVNSLLALGLLLLSPTELERENLLNFMFYLLTTSGFIVFGIQARDLYQKEKREQLERFGRLLKNSLNEIYIFDAKSLHFQDANQGSLLNLGYTLEELIQLTPLDLTTSFSRGEFLELLDSLREQEKERLVFETTHKRKDGSVYPVEVCLQLIANENPGVFIAIVQDITDRIESQKRLEHMAHHDALTGLPNRILLFDRMSQALARANRHKRQIALLFFDLDRFKQINDTLGHESGDKLLMELARRLKKKVRSGDTLARIGGDEFVLLLDDIASVEYLVPLVERFLLLFEEPFSLNENPHFVTTSIGISLFPHDGTDIPSLLKHADVAMYQAKQIEGNQYQFYSDELETITGMSNQALQEENRNLQ